MAQCGGRLAAGACGGLVGGLAVSALMLATERTAGKPSDLVRLGRRTASLLGSPYLHQNTMPAMDEQLRYHGTHLLLSSAMGMAWPMLRGLAPLRRMPMLRGPLGGVLFGIAWYDPFWGLVGPRLGLVGSPRFDGWPLAARRVGSLGLFGLLTALVSNRISRSR